MQYLIRLLPSVNNAARSQKKWIECLGLFGLCLYAIAFFSSKDICYVGEWFMVGAFILSVPHVWPQMKSDPLWIAFLILFSYLIFKAISTYFIYQEPITDILDAIRSHLRIFWIFVIGWWLGGTRIAMVRLLYIFLIGFFIQIFIGFETNLFEAIEHGRRVRFGLGPQFIGLYAATFLFVWLSLAKDLWGNSYKYLRIFSWIAIVLILLELTIITQTRAIWLAMMFVLLFFILSFILSPQSNSNLTTKFKKNMMVFGTISFLLITIPVAYWNSDILKNRLSEDVIAIKEILSESDSNIVFSESVDVRIKLWKWSIGKIKHRPIFGWKIEHTSKDFLPQSENIDKSVTRYTHVHNGYLEILLNQGVVGLSIFLFFPFYVIYNLWKMFKKDNIPYRFFMASCSFLIICAIANMTTGHITSWVFWPYFTIFLGVFYSPALWHRVSLKETGSDID